ncbi:MAG: hypothetical protein JXQ97_15410, partial [Natronospirillum sp.]
MTSPFKKLELIGIDLEHSSSLRRKDVRPPERRAAHYLENYDYTTLIYDCFYQPDKGCFVITAPRFLNLWSTFSRHLLLNGSPFKGRLKRYRWQRCEQIEVYAQGNDTLSVLLDGTETPIPSRSTEQNIFADMNVAVAMNKVSDPLTPP